MSQVDFSVRHNCAQGENYVRRILQKINELFLRLVQEAQGKDLSVLENEGGTEVTFIAGGHLYEVTLDIRQDTIEVTGEVPFNEVYLTEQLTAMLSL